MFEDGVVDDRDVECWEDGNESSNNSLEEERVATTILPPLIEDVVPAMVLAFRFLSEETAAEVDHLPGQGQSKPREAYEGGGTGTENELASLTVRIVAIEAEVSIAESPDNENKGKDAENGHPDPVDDHVDNEFGVEDSRFQVVRRAVHDVGNSNLHT